MSFSFPAALPAPKEEAQTLDNYIMAIATGDTKALELLYLQTRGAVYGFALSLCQNAQDAEDVLQDTYLHAVQGAGSYLPKGKAMAWLLAITKNLALMRLREKKKAIPLSQEEWNNAFQAQPDVTPEDRLLLKTLLLKLEDTERQIVTLHATAGLKHREIASLLSLPLPTVLSKYSRALKKLRNQLKEDPHAEPRT